MTGRDPIVEEVRKHARRSPANTATMSKPSSPLANRASGHANRSPDKSVVIVRLPLRAGRSDDACAPQVDRVFCAINARHVAGGSMTGMDGMRRVRNFAIGSSVERDSEVFRVGASAVDKVLVGHALGARSCEHRQLAVTTLAEPQVSAVRFQLASCDTRGMRASVNVITQ